MLIYINNHLWSANEREEILDRAYHIFTAKRRKVSLEAPIKKMLPQQEVVSSDSEAGETENSDSDDSDDSYGDNVLSEESNITRTIYFNVQVYYLEMFLHWDKFCLLNSSITRLSLA